MSESRSIRKIIHIDMDAFFASVEQLDNPELRGKPIAVGGSRQRGVVAAASYEARVFGVRSAMPSRIAYEKCPHLIFVKPRFSRYKEVSQQIREIFLTYTDLMEPLSLDEAFLDVTHNKMGIDSASKIAKEIKRKIRDKTGLTASAGIATNKFLAKMASDIHKPDGCTLILPENADAFIADLPIEKFFGIGKATAAKMRGLGIHRGADLRNYDRLDLVRRFGKMGNYYFDIVRGLDERPVIPNRERKSISAETTLDNDLEAIEDCLPIVEQLSQRVSETAQRIEVKGRTVSLKIRFSDFTTLQKQKSYPEATNDGQLLKQTSLELLEYFREQYRPVRLLGVGLHNFDHLREHQMELLFD
ncbi:MAG: DNA polymerase IV [Saprospiraceae bacterium]